MFQQIFKVSKKGAGPTDEEPVCQQKIPRQTCRTGDL